MAAERDNRLVDSVTARVEEVLAEALAELEAAREEVSEDAFDRDELLDVAAERDHLAADLELAKARVHELERQLETAKTMPVGSCSDRRRPALETAESRDDHGLTTGKPKELF